MTGRIPSRPLGHAMACPYTLIPKLQRGVGWPARLQDCLVALRRFATKAPRNDTLEMHRT